MIDLSNDVVAIVQARFGSSRMRGKVLETLGDQSVLAHVVDRCRKTPGVNSVCCAIPDTRDSDCVAEEASACGASVYRGPEQDVLRRFLLAARHVNATYIMRVTSDCPLTDPAVNGQVVSAVVSGDTDYACNNMPASWPHGLDCEAFSREALERADKEARIPYEREHVTPYIRESGDFKCINVSKECESDAERRWTLDYPEDLAFFQALWRELGSSAKSAGYRDACLALEQNPDIERINASRHRQRN